MKKALAAIGYLIVLIFERQHWYYAILYSLLLLLILGFSLMIAAIVSKIFATSDGGGTHLLVNIVIGVLFATSLAALWWVFIALAKKTATK